MHPVPASALLPGTLDWSCLPAVCLLACHHTSRWQGPSCGSLLAPRPLRCLDGQCHRSLLGGERGFLTGRRTCMQSTGSGQEEGALLTELLRGLAWRIQDTPEHVVIVYKREGLFNLCQTSCTVNFTMVCFALHARRLVLWPAR